MKKTIVLLFALLCGGMSAGSAAFAVDTAELPALIAGLKSEKYSGAVQKLYQKRLLILLPRILNGESVDTVLENANGTTALHNACGLSHVAIVRWLVENGANTKAKTAKGASVAMCVGGPNAAAINRILKSAPKKASSASTGAGNGTAPASVAGKKIEFRCADNSKLTFAFTDSNVSIDKTIPAGYGNRVEYKKTGAATAKLHVELWESMGDYTLTFVSATSGTADYKGVTEGCEESEKWIPFQIK